MLSKDQLVAAANYNDRKSRSMWTPSGLPWPWSILTPDTIEFAIVTAMFQDDHGLKVDGWLGPSTHAAIVESYKKDTRDHEAEEGTPPVIIKPIAGVSNQVILAGRKVDVPAHIAAAGFTMRNYVNDGVFHFPSYPRKSSLIHAVIHESVTRTQPGAVRILNIKRKKTGKKFGTQLMCDPAGQWTCHNDLATECVVHGNQLNRTSIGIETINPYTIRGGIKAPFDEVIKAKWWTWRAKGGKGLYVLPTPAQLKSFELMLPWICEVTGIPYEFPTADLNAGKRRIKGWDRRRKHKNPKKRGAAAQPDPGIVAHRDFASHADGRYILEHLINAEK